MILFGVSNVLSDVYDCAHALGKKITRIVLNAPEEKRERTKGFETRLREFNEHPLITPLEDFAPREEEEYFVVPTTPRKAVLIEFLQNNSPAEVLPTDSSDGIHLSLCKDRTGRLYRRRERDRPGMRSQRPCFREPWSDRRT